MVARQQVDDQTLQLLQGNISERFDSVKGQLKQLQGTIDSLEGHWKGVGAGAFNVKQTEINERMVHIAKLLIRFQEAIEVTRTTAGNSEDEVNQALRGVDVVSGYSGDAAAEKATSNLNSY